MDYKKLVASAISEAEKQKQEEEIKCIKDIVKAYLEKISTLEKERKELDVKLKALKADLEDLKTGRLDKIENKQGLDDFHDKNTLIIIKKIEKEYIPYYPWRGHWMVEWKLPYSYRNAINTNFIATGTNFQNFSAGTYEVGGNITNI